MLENAGTSHQYYFSCVPQLQPSKTWLIPLLPVHVHPTAGNSTVHQSNPELPKKQWKTLHKSYQAKFPSRVKRPSLCILVACNRNFWYSSPSAPREEQSYQKDGR